LCSEAEGHIEDALYFVSVPRPSAPERGAGVSSIGRNYGVEGGVRSHLLQLAIAFGDLSRDPLIDFGFDVGDPAIRAASQTNRQRKCASVLTSSLFARA
jgi:hypothetical protein